jgi:hypothetical protein
MKYLILFVLILSGNLVSSFACANQVLGAVGTTVNDQLSSNGKSDEATAPFSVRAGYRFKSVDVFGEFSFVKSSTGTDMVSIAQTNQEFLLWVRMSDPTAPNWKPFVALGAGAHLQSVSTRFGNQTETSAGGFEPLGAAAAGLEIRIVKMIEITLEGRATAAESYTPNPLFGFGGYLNFLF